MGLKATEMPEVKGKTELTKYSKMNPKVGCILFQDVNRLEFFCLNISSKVFEISQKKKYLFPLYY